MFGVNMRLLVGILTALILLAFLLIALWTGLRLWLHRRSLRRSTEDEQRRRFRPDGTPYPPRAEGICDRCGRVGKDVFHLPDGGRLCPICFEETI